jgi:hypothetical protein
MPNQILFDKKCEILIIIWKATNINTWTLSNYLANSFLRLHTYGDEGKLKCYKINN